MMTGEVQNLPAGQPYSVPVAYPQAPGVGDSAQPVDNVPPSEVKTEVQAQAQLPPAESIEPAKGQVVDIYV